MKKKRSKSGGEKNESGDLRKEQFEDDEITLCFFGAGGHVEISGILNFSPFGVEQQPPLTSSMTSSSSTSFLFLRCHEREARFGMKKEVVEIERVIERRREILR
ncbi:uncharacterized protein DS421_1g03730 [Arachis hypogaea]|nr:uncharacterized protein DS421_1g03730 [Arachis hypogaea]